jgi:hypothetical protein
MAMTYPEGQCRGCGSLPDDPEEERVECDFCHFYVERGPSSAFVRVCEKVFDVISIICLAYVVGVVAWWIYRGCPVVP